MLEAIEQAGGMLAGDSVVDLAEALVRIAAGEPADEVDFPESGDVAFDLALDALSAFVPGGGQATRALGLAAKAEKIGEQKIAKAAEEAIQQGRASRHTIEEDAKYAAERFPMNIRGQFGEHGKKKGVRRIAPSDPQNDASDMYERLGRGALNEPVPGHEEWTREMRLYPSFRAERGISSVPTWGDSSGFALGMTEWAIKTRFPRRWLSDGTCVVHRPETSALGSPSVEIARSPSKNIPNQRVHFMEVKTW